MTHPKGIVSAPSASSYGFHRDLQPQSFAQGVAPHCVAVVTETLETKGFDALTEIACNVLVRSALRRSAC